MKNKRISRIGETRKNKQGLTMQIVKYVNRDNIKIEFVETGERQWVRYSQFAHGTPVADLLKQPSRTECSFDTAMIIFISFLILALAFICGCIFWICK